MALQRISSADVDFLTSNGAIQIPIGTTAQRPSTPNVGYMRYNTDTGAMENYTANGWFKVSVAQPSIASISGTIYNSNTSTLTITGTNFGAVGANVTFAGANTATVSGLTPTNGGQSLSVTVPSPIYTIAAGGAVGVTVTNSDGATSGGYTMTVVGLPTGGNTITSSGNTKIHTFNSSGTFTVPTGFSATASYLIVAGGGGGGAWVGGGGGAGGMKTGTTSISVGSYPIVIGSGGAGSQYYSPGPVGAFPTNSGGTSGSNSTGFSQTSLGGGRGGSYTARLSPSGWDYANGGSGGGGGGASSDGSGSGTPGQGNNGGAGLDTGGNLGGGGGGAGAVGQAATPSYSGAGGAGLSSTITGSPVYYAGGGGGGTNGPPSSPAGTGGTGGGGAGTVSSPSGTTATSGTTNTGGGGGGSGQSSASPYSYGGSGGSGIVIISYTLS